MRTWPINPDTITNINTMRRTNTLHRYTRKISRCEKLLMAARHLIIHYHLPQDSHDDQLIRDIEMEIGRK